MDCFGHCAWVRIAEGRVGVVVPGRHGFVDHVAVDYQANAAQAVMYVVVRLVRHVRIVVAHVLAEDLGVGVDVLICQRIRIAVFGYYEGVKRTV